MRMPFGRHQGELIEDLPDDYLGWLITINLRGSLRDAIAHELDRRARRDHREDRHRRGGGLLVEIGRDDAQLYRELIDSGYRALARRLHPDVGGNVDDMVSLNSLVDCVRAQLPAAGGAR